VVLLSGPKKIYDGPEQVKHISIPEDRHMGSKNGNRPHGTAWGLQCNLSIEMRLAQDFLARERACASSPTSVRKCLYKANHCAPANTMNSLWAVTGNWETKIHATIESQASCVDVGV